ncbi:hypothetical protein PV326_000206, partial [Microctonus aethiopoides]
MGRGKTKYALIWWINTSHKDVVKLSVIPKKFQFVNVITPLVWQNYTTKTTTKTDAKILAISTDEHALNEMLITNMGMVHEPSNKILLPDIHDKKKALAEHMKFQSINGILQEDLSNWNVKSGPDIDKRFTNENMVSVTSGCNWQKNPSSTTDNSLPYPKSCTTYENDADYTCNDHYNQQLSSLKCQPQPITQIFPHNLETCYQRHIHQEIHNECSESRVRKPLDEKQCHDEDGINTFFGENDAKQISDEESDTHTDVYDSDMSNESYFEKNVQSTARLLSGVIPMKVTKESIILQEALLPAMKKTYEEQEKMNVDCKKTFK